MIVPTNDCSTIVSNKSHDIYDNPNVEYINEYKDVSYHNIPTDKKYNIYVNIMDITQHINKINVINNYTININKKIHQNDIDLNLHMINKHQDIDALEFEILNLKEEISNMEREKICMTNDHKSYNRHVKLQAQLINKLHILQIKYRKILSE